MAWRIKTIFPDGTEEIEEEEFETEELAEIYMGGLSSAYATAAEIMEENGPNTFDNDIIYPDEIRFEIYEE